MSKSTAIGIDKKWQTEDDLRVLTHATEIRKDSKRMAAVRALAKEKVLALQELNPPKEK